MARQSSHPHTAPPRHFNGAPRRRGRGWWYYLFGFFAVVTAICAAVVVGVLIGYVNTLPPIEQLENYSPPEVSVVYDRNGDHIAQFSAERRQVVPIDKIPKKLITAFLAIEDARFYDHFGVDLEAIGRTVRTNLAAGRIVQGASTITMQLPRNILTDVGREKTIERKIKEALLAFQIERRYSKDQILEFYLNQIFLGQNSYGIRAAAETYFSKSPEELTLAECATLAAIPKGPSIYNPLYDPERARKRRNLVLSRMRELGWITEQDYLEAFNSAMVTRPSVFKSNVIQSRFPYFVDGLYRELVGHYGISRQTLETAGLNISSTVDPEVQTIAQEELRKGLVEVEKKWQEKKPERRAAEQKDLPWRLSPGQTRLAKIVSVENGVVTAELNGYRGTAEVPDPLPYHNPEGVLEPGKLLDLRLTSVDHARSAFEAEFADDGHIQGSVVILDSRTGHVLAMVGGANFRDHENRGQYNRAIMGGRPSGSTIKPFFYSAALELGYAPHDMVIDEAVVYPSTPVDYEPRNYENRFFGPTTLVEGLQESRNVVTVRMFEAMGMKTALKQVTQFGPGLNDNAWGNKMPPQLAVCLGSANMTALELASAYQVFANHGVERRPQFFNTILDGEGKQPVKIDWQESVVIDPVTAYQMTYLLRQVVVQGSGHRAVGSRFSTPEFPEIAGKTGTTNDNNEAWFCGFTPDLVMIVYVGFDTQRPLGPQMTGGRIAAPIWADIFQRVYESRSGWRMKFDEPAGIRKVDVCAETGKKRSEVCARWGHKVYEAVPYAREKVLREECDGEARRPIISRASYDRGWARPKWTGGGEGFAEGGDTGQSEYDYNFETGEYIYDNSSSGGAPAAPSPPPAPRANWGQSDEDYGPFMN